MSRTIGPTYTLTIDNGASVSNTRLRFTDANAHLAGKQIPSGFAILAPAALTNTVKIRVYSGAVSAILQSGGADITLPAGKATPVIEHLGWESIELISVDGEGAAANEAAARTFTITTVVER